MLFNSLIFIFAFLPACLLGYYGICATRLKPYRFAFLSVMSLVFYAWASWKFAALLCLSTAVNLVFAQQIQALRDRGKERAVNAVLAAGIGLNLLFLCYFKYTGFLVANLNLALNAHLPLPNILLPLGISFYTFMFMACLIDSARGQFPRLDSAHFVSYSLFFPHLLAGPIVHYQELVPQMVKLPRWSRVAGHVAAGAIIFAIGLFKKTVIADTMAIYSNQIFAAVDAGRHPGLLMSWLAALDFTLQIYFDFSGYSDMAIGASRMFGFRLPANFHSPLKAGNIMDFWRRWHMTLQRFIVAYLYPPLAVALTRWAVMRGLGRWPEFFVSLAIPTVLTFVVVGAWHGAGWNFIVFGLMHGIYISLCEAWRLLRKKKKKKAAAPAPTLLARLPAHLLTLLAVLLANIVFRASTLTSAWTLHRGMFGFGAGDMPAAAYPALAAPANIALVVLGFFIVLTMPNTQQLMARYWPVLDWAKWRGVSPPLFDIQVRRSLPWAVATGLVLFLGVLFISRAQTVFIYFQF